MWVGLASFPGPIRKIDFRIGPGNKAMGGATWYGRDCMIGMCGAAWLVLHAGCCFYIVNVGEPAWVVWVGLPSSRGGQYIVIIIYCDIKSP